MDHDGFGDASGSAFSPARNLAGPSRTRSLRGSDRKPYARPVQNGGATPLASSPLVRRRGSGQEEEERLSPLAARTTPTSATAPRSGLFSTLTRAITKPLSWLSTSSHSAAQSDRRSLLPSSASTGSVADLAERRAATRSVRLRGKDSYLSNMETGDIESHATTSNLNAAPPSRSVGAGLGGMSSSASMSAIAPRSRTRHFDTPGDMLPPSAASPPSSRRTLNIARAATSRGADTDFGPASGGPSSPVFSSASAAVRAHGRQGSLQPSSSLHRLATFQSTPAARRGGSIAPSESSSMRNGEAGAVLSATKSPAYAYGFGSERRLGGLTSEALASRSTFGPTSGLTPSSSLSHLPSRSPFATRPAPEAALKRSGSVAGIYAQSELGAGGDAASSSRLFGPATPARLGGSVLGSSSRAMSPALSRSGSALGLSSRARPWSSLNLAPPRGKPSDGEGMMKDLASARRIGTPTGSAAPSVIGGRDSRANTPLSARLGKRDASEALDLGGGFGALDLHDTGSEMGSVSGSARKKQMVWDPELGFISMDDLRAREPPTAVPRNEAERILGVLEGMRTPLGDARKEGALGGRTRSGTSTPSRLTQSISVPLPSPSAARAAQSTPDTRRGTRASSRLNQSTPAPGEDSMRAKLKRTTRATGTPATTRGSRRRAKSEYGSEDEEDAQEAAVQKSHGDDKEEEEREPTPPRRVTRGMARAKREATVTPPPPTRSSKAAGKKTPVKATPAAKSPARRSKRGKAKSPSLQPADEHMEEEREEAEEAQSDSQQATETADGPESSERVPARSKSKFQVLTADASSSSSSRARSSLRQGIVKTSRTHGKSGKISAWDSDDEDGGEDGNEDGEMAGVDIGELKKIQLPKDFFPSGFKFGAAATSGSDASSVPAASQPTAADKQERAPQTTSSFSSPANGDAPGASLLGRLGGFAPAPATTTPAKSPPSKPSSGFSIQPAAKSGGASTAPAFSFAPPPLPASQPSSERASKQAPAPSDFFAKPPAPAANVAAQADEAPKKGPIPNFFGSANKPAESGSLTVPSSSETRTSPAPFSFGPPATQSAEKSASPSPSPAPTFSFGKTAEASKSAPSASGATTSSGGFSFGSSAASTPVQAASEAPKKSVPNFFGAAADKAPETATAPTPAPATSNPFGSLAGVEKSGGASPFGGFGAAKSESKEDSVPKAAGGGFSFGAPPPSTTTSSTKTPAAASPFGGFTGFGAASAPSSSSTGAGGEKQKRGADGDQEAGGERASKKSVGFSFGNPSTSTATNGAGSGFSFGAPSSAAPSESNKSASPAPFSFGAAPAGNDAGKAGQPSTTSATGGGFNFGSAANSSAGGSVPASPAPTTTGFSFGQTSGGTSGATSSAGAPTGGFSFKPATTGGSTSTPSTGGFSFGKPASSTTDTGASKPFSFGAPATPAQPASNGGAAAGNDMMDDTSPSQNYTSTTQNTTGGFGGGGFGGSSKPASGTSSTGGFSFGSPAPAPAPAQGTMSGFSFGASKLSGVPSFSFGAPSGSSSAPAFGAGALGSAPSTPTTNPGGFNFGTPSSAAPASPAPTAGGGAINFNFAPSQPASSANGGAGGSAPFMFGGAPGGQPNGAQANGAGAGAGAGGMFQFGSTAPGTPSGTGAAAPFQFGAGGGGGAPAGGSVPGSPAPQGQPVLFNIGAGGGAPPLGGAGGAPGGRQLKGLPRPRRR